MSKPFVDASWPLWPNLIPTPACQFMSHNCIPNSFTIISHASRFRNAAGFCPTQPCSIGNLIAENPQFHLIKHKPSKVQVALEGEVSADLSFTCHSCSLLPFFFFPPPNIFMAFFQPPLSLRWVFMMAAMPLPLP